MGTTIPAKLINTVLSADQDSPVIAEIVEDVFWQNSVLIPQGTKAIGQGNLDESTQRLRTRFHTLVYPDGSEHALDGLALQPDGSSGLPGNYHSGRLEKHSGKFLGDFVGGVAQGLKDKRAEGMAGLTHEPGSLKNGLLNGLADSAFDYAQSSAEDMKNTRAVLEVPKGSVFTIYLEKEYIR
jgi:type IV secretory pathway VirB10-like protein